MIVRRTRTGIDEKDTIKVPARGRHMIYPVLAATAVANNMILVTRNVKDFQAIQEVSPLMVESWWE